MLFVGFEMVFLKGKLGWRQMGLLGAKMVIGLKGVLLVLVGLVKILVVIGLKGGLMMVLVKPHIYWW